MDIMEDRNFGKWHENLHNLTSVLLLK